MKPSSSSAAVAVAAAAAAPLRRTPILLADPSILSRYEPSLSVDFQVNHSGQPFPSSEISSSQDSVLTSLALLGLYQTGTERSLVSLFDSNYQYIVAEAVPSIPLTPGLPSDECPVPLIQCGTAVPRRHAACEYVLFSVGDQDGSMGLCDGADDLLPLTVVPDLTADSRFSSKPYCQFGPSGQFFAAVPIRTKAGINIGVYCVMSAKRPEGWNDECAQRLRDISATIMRHFEANRLRNARERNERMNRGLGLFIQGKSTATAGPQSAPSDDGYRGGDLDLRDLHHQRLEQSPVGDELPHGRASATEGPSRAWSNKQAEAARASTGSDGQAAPLHAEASTPHTLCSKAATIIRETFEVRGCLFFNARLGSYAARPARASRPEAEAHAASQLSTSSSDEQHTASPEDAQDSPCDLLGMSVAENSSVHEAQVDGAHGPVSKKFLAKLLRRYPHGTIFNFDADGDLLSSDSSEDDDPIASIAMKSTPPVKGTDRRREGEQVRQAFPDARSVAFMPVWDSKRERWFAGIFIHTDFLTRVFTAEGELSVLRAFAKLVSAEVLTMETLEADKAKADALGSLSHELRSPLHGIILSTELLAETRLSFYQENISRTIETCCRTLLDTIDHLLDYSKINSVAAGRKRDSHLTSQKLSKSPARHEVGKSELSVDGRLDVVVEEVLDSLFAGFNSQHLATRQSSTRLGSLYGDPAGHSQSDAARATAQLCLQPGREVKQNKLEGDVLIYFSVDPTCNWMFNFQAGAVRRIVMNLFGNSLKYTTRGSIRVSLTQEAPAKPRTLAGRVVKLLVEDTGKGIGQDYLRHRLFKPFAQEDELSAGTGLGLSFVKKIVSQLRGQISVRSEVGVGTTVMVSLPLMPSSPPPQATRSPDEGVFEARVRELKGLRVCVLGFESLGSDTGGLNGRAIVEEVCRLWLRMELISDPQAQEPSPDIILRSDDTTPQSYRQISLLSKTPNVVICRNALVAYQQFRAYESDGFGGVFEFISQP